MNAYETFTGDQVGGSDFSRILGGVAMATGGINGGLARNAAGKVTGGFQAVSRRSKPASESADWRGQNQPL